ncbi:MAG: peptide ABC transporter substrate-binding protein [Alphaproteobacteria bacterium]|nr:peptide ABC transporter substrate-binding protein [Alphaproteobacteria bacterium]
MRTLPITYLLAACTSTSTTFGLSRADQPADHLVFNNATEPETIDPTQATGSPDGRIADELFEGLTEYDPDDLSPVPAHALSWETHPDGRGYTFHLRDDAVWSNGRPVTTHDYLWSWEHVLRPHYLARYAQQLYLLQRAPAYNEGRALRVVTGPHAGTDVEVVATTARRTLEAIDVGGVSVREGATVQVEGAADADPVTVVVRASCPDLSELRELLDCTGEPVRGSVPAAALEPAWPLADQRVVTRAVDVTDRQGGPRGTLARGDDVVLLELLGDAAVVYIPVDERTGLVPADALVDPRVGHVRLTVQALPPIDWDAATPAAPPPVDTDAPTVAVDGAAPSEPAALPAFDVGLDAVAVTPEVLGVRALDDHTLQVRLSGVAPYFLQLTSHYTLRPANQEAWEAHGSRWTRPENIVTDGPFLLADHVVRDHFQLEKNPDWWGADTVALEHVTAWSIDNQHTSANLYRAGYTDFTVSNDVPSEFVPILQDAADFHVGPALSVYFYRLNTQEPPLDDPRVRRALSMAIDRRDIVRVTRAGQLPATHIVPPGLPHYDDGVPGPDFDPEGARKLLAEAGYPDGVGFPEISILYNTLESHKLIAAVIQAQWKEHLGITVQLENREWKTYLKAVVSQDYNVARAGWIGDYLDPMTFLELWQTDGGNNNTGWSDPRYDALITQATQEPDPDVRAQILRTAEAMLNEQMPFIPLYWYVWFELTQPDVKGKQPNLLDQHPLRFVSLDRGSSDR